MRSHCTLRRARTADYGSLESMTKAEQVRSDSLDVGRAQKQESSEDVFAALSFWTVPNFIDLTRLVRERVQFLASCIAADDSDGAGWLCTDDAIVHRTIGLATGRRSLRCGSGQELVGNRSARTGALNRVKGIATLTRGRRGTVVGQIAIDEAGSRRTGGASRANRAAQS